MCPAQLGAAVARPSPQKGKPSSYLPAELSLGGTGNVSGCSPHIHSWSPPFLPHPIRKGFFLPLWDSARPTSRLRSASHGLTYLRLPDPGSEANGQKRGWGRAQGGGWPGGGGSLREAVCLSWVEASQMRGIRASRPETGAVCLLSSGGWGGPRNSAGNSADRIS